MAARNDVAVFVLAGGKSSRMGRDKAFIEFDGQILLARALETGGKVAGDVCIVGPATKFGAYGAVVEDQFPESGPLGGIHAALTASQTELNVILAVDLPFITPELLEFLLDRASSLPSLVTLARVEGRLHSLCAVYRRQFGNLAEAALRQGRYKIDGLFTAENVQVIDQSEILMAGYSLDMFRNLNTPEDVAAAKK